MNNKSCPKSLTRCRTRCKVRSFRDEKIEIRVGVSPQRSEHFLEVAPG